MENLKGKLVKNHALFHISIVVVPMENICWTMRWDSQSILGVHSFVSPQKCSCFSRETHYTVQRIFHMNLWKSFTVIKLEGFILSLNTFSFYISQCVYMCGSVYSAVWYLWAKLLWKKTTKKTQERERENHLVSITNWPGIHLWVYFSSTSVFVKHSKTKIALSSPLEKSHSLRH